MKRRAIVSAVLLAACGLAGAARAEEWTVVGAPRGMGGAGVAHARGPYWNPAALGKKPEGKDATKISNFLDELDFAVLFGLDVSAQGDIIAEGDDVVDLVDQKDFDLVQERLDSGTATAEDIESALVLIKEINDLNRRGEGIYASSGTHAYLRLGKNIGLVAGAFAWSGADPNVDLNLFNALSAGGFATLFALTGTGSVPSSADGLLLAAELEAAGVPQDEARQLAWFAEDASLDLSDADVRTGIVLAATATSTAPGDTVTLYNNKSGFTLSGVIVQELGLNLSLPVVPEVLALGVTAKLLHGITYRRDYVIKDIDTGKSLLDETYQDFRENRKVSDRFGLDLGLLARPVPILSLGLTVHNLTRPSFATEDGAAYVVRPQVRAGVALTPHRTLTLALDCDVTENESQALDGFYSRLLGAGLEFKPADNRLFGFALRAGFFQNLAMKAEEAVWTAGLSLRVWAFELEIAGSSSLYFKTMADVQKETTGDPSDPNPAREVDMELPERMGVSATFRFLLKF